MGVNKGTDNFKAFRLKKQEISLTLLRAELDKADKRKMLYPDKATLVSDMAHRTKIDRTTLVRNPNYHRALLEFLAGQAGASTFVADKDASPELLRAKLIDAQLLISKLQADLQLAAQKVALEPASELSHSDSHTAYVDTVWAMRAVLERVNADGLLFEVDLERCEIRDLAAAPGRQKVLSGTRLKPFMDALKRLKEQEM